MGLVIQKNDVNRKSMGMQYLYGPCVCLYATATKWCRIRGRASITVNIVTLFSSNIDKYGINGKATAHSTLWHLSFGDYLKNYVTRGQTVMLIGGKWKLEAFGTKSLLCSWQLKESCNTVTNYVHSHNEQFWQSKVSFRPLIMQFRKGLEIIVFAICVWFIILFIIAVFLILHNNGLCRKFLKKMSERKV